MIFYLYYWHSDHWLHERRDIVCKKEIDRMFIKNYTIFTKEVI